MALFSYHPRSSLHVCNDCLKCDQDRYKRLVDKEKISEEHQLIIESLDGAISTDQIFKNTFCRCVR